MVLNNLRGFDRWFIELDDDAKGDLIVKWHDNQIRRKTKVNVAMDYVAVFTSQGEVVDTLGPGRHELETGAPILTGWLIDHVSNDRYYDLDLHFVNTKERTVKFGGVVDTVSTGEGTDLVAKLRAFGMFAFKVIDPVVLLRNFWGTSSASNITATEEWVSSQVLAAIREELPKVLGDRSLLALGATQDETETVTILKANLTLGEYGLNVTRFGELNINMSDEDAAVLKRFVERQRLVELAGGYREFAVGEALTGMGNGDAGNGSGGDSAAVLLAMMMSQNNGGLFQHPPGGASLPPVTSQLASPRLGVSCFSCQTVVPAGGVFCSKCGCKQTCAGCGAGLQGGPFCSKCGQNNTPK
jgi:membrane protease subunit (stomatin/prohibitin family)